MKIKNRVKELRRVPASELRPNPKNWRTHPESQHNALRKILADVGMANACVAREMPDGSLMLLDGHLRAETASTSLVPVVVLNVTDNEADTILATFDPIAGMAKTNQEAFAALSSAFHEVAERLQEVNDADAKAESDAKSEDKVQNSASRMVQLFFDNDNIEEFQSHIEKLAAAYGTEGITETVLEALDREASR